MKRLEPTDLRAFAQNHPGWLRIGKSGELLRTEILQIKQAADLLPRACRYDQPAWGGQCLQSRRKVWCFTDDGLFSRRALADEIAYNRKSSGDADAHLQFVALCVQSTDCIDSLQSGSDCPLGIVLVGARVAEINQYAVAHVFGDETVVHGNGLIDCPMIRADQRSEILRIELCRECRRADEVAEHDAQLSAFWRLSFRRCGRGTSWRSSPAQLRDGVKQTAAMPNQRHANIPQVVSGQRRQDLCVDGVVTKCVSILLEPKLAQPLKDFDRLPSAIGCHRLLSHG